MLALENRSLDSHDEDSILGIMTEEELKAHEEKQNRRAFSYLSADAVRWMQKRRPAADSSAKNFIPPSRVLQLRAIFRGLDFDGSGEIDLDELKDAVRFVASKDSGDSGPPLFEHPEQIVDLFESMDIDKNGNVDFDEFLIGMTSEVANSSGGMGGARMQSAFFDFANKHRRETIVEKINDTSMNTQERYNELRKLYNMKYLKEEPKDGEVSEMIEKMKKEAEAQKKEMNQAAEKYRRAELNRARAAFIYFENEAPGKGKSEYFSQNQQYVNM
jgi:Ca2+-binding EF-hand superfamily protein